MAAARQKEKEKKASAKIKKGVRVQLQRHQLWHIFSIEQRKKNRDMGSSFNIFGTVVFGTSGMRGWDVQFDIFPLNDAVCKHIGRERLNVVEVGAEEQHYDREVDRDPLSSTFTMPPPNPLHSDSKTPQQAFLKLPTKEITESQAFTFQWGKQTSEKVDWGILGDDEMIDWGTPDMSSQKATEEISCDDDTGLIYLFFEKMFPCIKGHAKLM
jgi:hypothetical protein